MTPQQRALVAENLGLVGLHLRNRVPTPAQPMRHREYEDLFQEGCIALMRAAARYDPHRHGSFAAFALLRIRGAVFAALHERFTIMRVPLRAAKERAGAAAQRGGWPGSAIQELTNDLSLEDRPRPTGGETIRHALRRRFERAVRQALADLQARKWRQRNPGPIIRRVAAERLLISSEAQRTPLRQIAREAGVSSGRASAYEKLLHQTVSRYCQADNQAPLLIRYANEDSAGFDGPLDEPRRQGLLRADLDAFEANFRLLERSAQAMLVYELIERSASAVGEVVCNLYRLTRIDDEESGPDGPDG